MDRQLEICGGRKILVQGICYNPNCCASCIARNLRSNSLDSTLWPFDTSSDFHSNQASSPSDPATDVPQCVPVLRYDIRSGLYGYRHAVRTVSSLPILCLYHLVNTISAMESWLASNIDIRCLGGPRMGMECVSEYQNKLDCGSRMFGGSGVFYLVGHDGRPCCCNISYGFCGRREGT